MSRLRDKVHSALDGMEMRQKARDWNRYIRRTRNRLRSIRSRGEIDTLGACRSVLQEFKIGWTETSEYGLVKIETEIGFRAVYRPDGIITYSRKVHSQIAGQDAQLDLFQ